MGLTIITPKLLILPLCLPIRNTLVVHPSISFSRAYLLPCLETQFPMRRLTTFLLTRLTPSLILPLLLKTTQQVPQIWLRPLSGILPLCAFLKVSPPTPERLDMARNRALRPARPQVRRATRRNLTTDRLPILLSLSGPGPRMGSRSHYLLNLRNPSESQHITSIMEHPRSWRGYGITTYHKPI